MAVEIDTAASNIDLYDRLLAFLQDSGPGPGWTLLSYDSVTTRALFHAEGLAGADDIYFGFALFDESDDDAYAIGMWMFKAYNPALDELAQPGYSGISYLPISNAPMPYWFVANEQRLIIVAKVSTTYPAAYIGKFLPYGTPGEYGLPYYRAAPVTSPEIRWSTVNEDYRNFWDPGLGSDICRPDGQWTRVSNFTEISGENDRGSDIYTWPYQGLVNTSAVKNRYRELRDNLDGTHSLFPIVLHGVNPANDIYGELDGAFAVSGFNSASENVIEIGGDDYLVVQNLHRTARYYYAAIKLE